jgi:branched-chain amino acid aminotransferase
LEELVYINGKFIEASQASVSVFDHGLLYGDGIFEGIRVYGGRVFRLAQHVQRLYKSARALLIEIPMSPDEMKAAVEETVSKNSADDAYLRLMVTRGAGPMGLDPSGCTMPTVIIIVTGIQLYPQEMYERGIAVASVPTRRMSADMLEPRVKSLNYLNNVLAKAEAARSGCLEAVMLNAQGYVAECTADNIFVVAGGRLLTPPPHMGALDGVTMRTVMEVAEHLNIESSFSPLTRYDVYTADECFLTGTGAELMPVVEIDGRRIGNGEPGDVTDKIRKAFGELTRWV